MTGSRFVDTDVTVYAYDSSAGDKQSTAQQVLREGAASREGVIPVAAVNSARVAPWLGRAALLFALPRARHIIPSSGLAHAAAFCTTVRLYRCPQPSVVKKVRNGTSPEVGVGPMLVVQKAGCGPGPAE